MIYWPPWARYKLHRIPAIGKKFAVWSIQASRGWPWRTLLENLLDSDIAIPRRCRDVLVAAGERMGLDATGRRDVSLSDGRTSK